jgi:hypothetical protein
MKIEKWQETLSLKGLIYMLKQNIKKLKYP